jgi:hypothetical protein
LRFLNYFEVSYNCLRWKGKRVQTPCFREHKSRGPVKAIGALHGTANFPYQLLSGPAVCSGGRSRLGVTAEDLFFVLLGGSSGSHDHKCDAARPSEEGRSLTARAARFVVE